MNVFTRTINSIPVFFLTKLKALLKMKNKKTVAVDKSAVSSLSMFYSVVEYYKLYGGKNINRESIVYLITRWRIVATEEAVYVARGASYR